jgi:hypothetical protein
MKMGTIRSPWRYDVARRSSDPWRVSDAAAQGRYACCRATHRATCKLIVDVCQLNAYVANDMIRSFESKPCRRLWEKGRTSKIDAKMHERILRPDRLDAAAMPQEMNIPALIFML